MKRLVLAVGLLAVVIGSSKVFAAEQDACRAPVATKEGPVTGAKAGREAACAYLGIPYAKPPVGNLRWRPPEPAVERSAPLAATKISAQCIQASNGMPSLGNQKESEDCLYLNIWRPQKSGKFPVMVWIHGGDYINGSGGYPMYWGDHLAAQKDVVFVSINYRLGALGFLARRELSKEDAHSSSGSYGLLDQVAALAWVRDNIGNFSGDPGNVTIFGESTGGWSVCSILASPLAAGLFSRAIIQSGGCDNSKTMGEGFKDGDEFAASVGCTGADALQCLRKTSPKQIVKATNKVWSKTAIAPEILNLYWAPHEDGWSLKQRPIKALSSGDYNQVPLLVGSTRDEYKIFVLTIAGVRSYPKSKVAKVMKDIFGEQVLAEFEKLYPWKSYRRPMDAALDALGDASLGCNCFAAALAASFYKPVYYYRFDYDRNIGPHILGAAHGTELPFVFRNFDRSPYNLLYAAGDRESRDQLEEIISDYWVNFARTGDPNGKGLAEWPAFDPQTKARMILDIPPWVETNAGTQRCDFWRTMDLRFN